MKNMLFILLVLPTLVMAKWTVLDKELGLKAVDVSLSAYTSSVEECDDTPSITSISYILDASDKRRVVAVSHDLYKELKNSIVFLAFKEGNDYRVIDVRVVDLMNKRFTKHVDLYYGNDKKGALQFGRKHARLMKMDSIYADAIPSSKIYKWASK